MWQKHCEMIGFICFVSLVLFSSVNGGNVVKQISPKDFPFSSTPSRSHGRIIAGNQARTDQFPYQVSIRSITGSTASICGGSILSSTFVLTAAHCTKGYSRFEIGFGSNQLNSPIYRMISTTKTEHPDFNPTTLNNDISLIKLPMEVPFSSSLAPIQLPKRSQAVLTYLSKRAVVSGFGRTSDDSTHVSQNLNFVDMNVIGNPECKNIFGSKIVTNNVICARGVEKSNRNACLGDSGGPMAIDDDGVKTIIGIVSFVSSRGCSFGDPSGYTRVGKYLNWISKQTGIPIRN